MRDPVRGGLRGRLPLPSILLAFVALTGCQSQVEAPRDTLLEDSLGLAPGARVQSVVVAHLDGAEAVVPDSVMVSPGEWVDFRTMDAHPRVVHFELDSLAPEARRALSERGLDASPPLVRPGVHWVFPADSLPPGRYPYTIDGTGLPGTGVVVVARPR